ncbi:MAG TPA: sulfatase, partial [Verrucomicrobiales bacterium]|nr:sulfatase [Verrucomicrobiales bacterium]
MHLQSEIGKILSRRAFLARSTTGLGAIALGTLLRRATGAEPAAAPGLGALPGLHFAPKAKRVIYMFQSGAPSHLDLFDPKPKLA